MSGIGTASLRGLRALGAALGLLLAVYVPTFALVAALHLSIAHAVPVIIVVSTVLALALMRVLQGRAGLTFADFGLRWPKWRDLVVAIVIAVPVATVVNVLLSPAHESGPLAGLNLAPALALLYFGLGAPLQEELIFRGLLQTATTRVLAVPGSATARTGLAAIAIAATLFALAHLAVGPWTAAAALVLGLLAGEWRRRSASLIPAIAIHAIFNLPGLLVAIR
ncbi:MAG: CPBP family intramembrane metalloprotease [Xanthomonadaceae bacterium]|nr:CPBP family intramembrane metalloprotease [Xanthomonadaceae bacterium]MDE2246425.1 CPBP family intramembrane metalloprotease [Xanthomonadaceae bacterium]